MIILFNEKKECYGCSACFNVCPTNAIEMNSDEYGFSYPHINHDLCIKCGLCRMVCPYISDTISAKAPIKAYAAVNRKKDTLKSSASGGVFPALASIVLGMEGIVFGCTLNKEMKPHHIAISSIENLYQLQGSKYVQSDIGRTYCEVKESLDNGIYVLFTGTPCQIAGLKTFLGKEYNNLITADLICHGVASSIFFEDYIKYLEGKLKGRVIKFIFRDKSKGLRKLARVIYEKNGRTHSKLMYPIESYYYKYFLDADIDRDSCYECKYACGNRVGDFTMGDYWGIENIHPEIDKENGVSVLMVNSQKGLELIDEIGKYMEITESDFEKARLYNGQLNEPSPKSNRRDGIFKIWKEGGNVAVAKDYHRRYKNQIYKNRTKELVPEPVIAIIKRILGK